MSKSIVISALAFLCFHLQGIAQNIAYTFEGQFTTTLDQNTLDPEPLGMTVDDVTDFTFTMNLNPSAGFIGILPAGGSKYGHDVYGYSIDAIVGATLTTSKGWSMNFAPSVFHRIGPSFSGEYPIIASDTDLSLGAPTRWNFYIGTTPGGNPTWDFEEIRVSQFNDYDSGKTLLPSAELLTFRYARYVEGFTYIPGENSPSPQGRVEGSSTNVSLIPEPTNLLLVILGSSILLCRRGRSH